MQTIVRSSVLALAVGFAFAGPHATDGAAQDATPAESGEVPLAQAEQTTTLEQHGITQTAAASAELRDQPMPSDQAFLDRAIADHLAGIAYGKLAQQRGGPRVQAFGADLQRDHKRALTELVALSPVHRQRPVVARLDPDVQARLDDLQSLQGVQFDRRFSELMLQKQNADLDAFQAASTATTYSQPVRSLTREWLPTLERHVSEADALQQQLRLAATEQE